MHRIFALATVVAVLAACQGGSRPALQLSEVSPADGAIDVPLGSAVAARFSRPLDCSTATASALTLSTAAGPVAGRVTCAASTATFTPDAPLSPRTRYEIAVSNTLRAGDGTALPGAARPHFTTGPLTVRAMTPAPGSTTSALGAAVVRLDVWGPLDCASVDGTSLTLSAAAGPVAAAVACNGVTASLLPASPLAPGERYAVDASAAVRDLGGHALEPFHEEFTTAAPAAVEAPVTNGSVWNLATTEDGLTVYLGGEFTAIGPRTGSFASLDATSGHLALPPPQVDGSVLAIAADNAGGWYLGGLFSRVGRSPRQNLAHLLADGSLDAAWDPGADGEVSALAVAGGAVYAGGDFGTAGGASRSRLAALDASTGAALAWAPAADGPVRALAVADGVVYAGGGFAVVDGQPRARLAALDATTGATTAWDPGADGEVRALALAGGTLHAGGAFLNVAGQPRAHLAAVDVTTGAATAWDPGADGTVHALATGPAGLYAAGDFSIAGGAPRDHLAALDPASGTATAFRIGALGPWLFGGRDWGQYPRLFALSWVPPRLQGTGSYRAPGVVARALAVSGSTVYLGGWFEAVNGSRRASAAAFDATSGALLPWDPAPDGVVYALAAAGDAVSLGGNLGSLGAVPRNGFAAIDARSGAILPWDPHAQPGPCSEGSRRPMAVRGSTIYLGGGFASIGGLARAGLAAVDATSGAPLAFDLAPRLLAGLPPQTCPQVVGLALAGSTLYVRGYFFTLGNQTRYGLAAVDLGSGQVTPWDPWAGAGFVSNQTTGIDVVGPLVHVDAAAYDGTSGDLAWAWPWGAAVNTAANPDGAYASLRTPAGVEVHGADPRTGTARWGPVPLRRSPYVFTEQVTARGGRLYVAGIFDAAAGVPRANLAALDAATGALTAWDPSPNDQVNAVLPMAGAVAAGGWFTAVGGEARRGFALLPP